VVDPAGRFLGVMTDLSAGGMSCWSVVPMVSIRGLAGAAGAPMPIAQQNDITPPPYEDPASAVGLTFRAASLVIANKFEDARVLLNSAVKKDPKSEDAHFWLGRINFSQQKFEDAADEFQKAGTADPTFHMAWHMAGAAYNQAGRYLDAEKMYAKALEANPRSAATYCNLGGAYYNEHRYDKAIEAFRKSISMDPQYQQGLAYNNLAMTYVSQGNRVEAEKVYSELAQVNADWAKRLRDVLDGKKAN
jgi:tetratricopeptide (TPR) repeat protein